MSRLEKAIEDFDLRSYVLETLTGVVEAGSSELRVSCFSPKGCNGDDEKRHLYVNTEKKQWLCFKCGYGSGTQPGTASLIRFMCDAEGVPPLIIRHRLVGLVRPAPNMVEGLSQLLQSLYLEKPATESIGVLAVALPIPAEFHTLDSGSCRNSGFEYLESRGFTDRREWDKYNVRYCVKSPADEKGLWGGRVIFPLHNLEGQIRSFAGRACFRDPTQVRWRFKSGTDISQLLWPLWVGGVPISADSIIMASRAVILVEGIFDAWAVNTLLAPRCPRPLALCTFGKKLTRWQLSLLRQLNVVEVILAWDNDARKEMAEAAKILSENGIRVELFPFEEKVVWVDGYDLADLMLDLCREGAKEILKNELAQAFPISDREKYIAWCYGA